MKSADLFFQRQACGTLSLLKSRHTWAAWTPHSSAFRDWSQRLSEPFTVWRKSTAQKQPSVGPEWLNTPRCCSLQMRSCCRGCIAFVEGQVCAFFVVFIPGHSSVMRWEAVGWVGFLLLPLRLHRVTLGKLLISVPHFPCLVHRYRNGQVYRENVHSSNDFKKCGCISKPGLEGGKHGEFPSSS